MVPRRWVLVLGLGACWASAAPDAAKRVEKVRRVGAFMILSLMFSRRGGGQVGNLPHWLAPVANRRAGCHPAPQKTAWKIIPLGAIGTSGMVLRRWVLVLGLGAWGREGSAGWCFHDP
jgi:hypothetical protein